MPANKKGNGAVAAFLGVAAAFGGFSHAHHHHHGHGHAVPAHVMNVSAGSLSTRIGWARSLLKADGLPRTRCNLNAVTAWELHEGGGFGNQAAANPLNVNPPPGTPWPGYHAIGAWAFPDATTGLRYTVATLNNGYYGGVLAALRRGNNAQAVCDAIMASPWAASHYGGTLTASC